jgi:hypothetical protein
VARADDNAIKAAQAFAAICAAAIDERPDIASIAASMELEAASGMKDAAIAFGRTSLRVFNSSQTKQNIIITAIAFSDSYQIDCRSTVPVHTSRAELENLVQSLKLEGGFVDVAAVTTGRWKRPGNKPLVFVTMLSAVSTVLSMQRIDLSAPPSEKK